MQVFCQPGGIIFCTRRSLVAAFCRPRYYERSTDSFARKSAISVRQNGHSRPATARSALRRPVVSEAGPRVSGFTAANSTQRARDRSRPSRNLGTSRAAFLPSKARPGQGLRLQPMVCHQNSSCSAGAYSCVNSSAYWVSALRRLFLSTSMERFASSICAETLANSSLVG